MWYNQKTKKKEKKKKLNDVSVFLFVEFDALTITAKPISQEN